MNISRLQQILKSRKITQSELANNVGLTQGGVSYILNGGDMKVSQLEKIADYLKVDVAIFFSEVEDLSNVAEPLINYQNINGSNNFQQNEQSVKEKKLKDKISVLEAKVETYQKHLYDCQVMLKDKEKIIATQETIIEMLNNKK